MRLILIAAQLLLMFALAAEEIPSEFSIKFNAYSHKSPYTLESLREEPFAKITKEEKDSKLTLLYENLAGAAVAKAIGECLATESKLSIYTDTNQLLGSIIRKKNRSSPAIYQLFNAEKFLVAEGTMNWLGSRLLLSDPLTHRTCLMLYRPYFHLWGDYWYIQIYQKEILDLKVLAFLGALETYIDRRNFEIKPQL